MTHVAVVGAGPYGLSVAAHLREGGVETRVFGSPMQMWREHMPAGMVLKSDAFASNLSAPGNAFPLERYCALHGLPYMPVGMRTPLQTLVNYGLEFQRRHVGNVEEARIDRVEHNGRAFELTTDAGERLTAGKVVIASGLMAFRRDPTSLGNLPDELWSHSSALRDPARFAGKRVLVIGAGQSALESAALLREAAAEVTVVTRRPLFWFNPASEEVRKALWHRVRRPNFGLGPGWRTWFLSEAPGMFRYLPTGYRVETAYRSFGPAGSGWLKHRVDGLISVHVGAIENAVDVNGETRVVINGPEGRRSLAADHIIAATGYLPDIRRLEFLAPIRPQIATMIRTQSGAEVPRLNRWFGASVPGLHFVGALSAATFGPPMRFIYGTRFTCERMVPAMAPRLAPQFRSELSRQPA